MKHRAQVSHFGRDTDARRALIRGLVYSLVEHGRIETTLAKAKELRRHAERAVTVARRGDLNSRRLLLARFPNQDTVRALFDVIAPRFKTRPGGYTRILKTGTRAGDRAEMALIEWVDYVLPEKAAEETKGAKKKLPKKPAKKAGAKKAAAKGEEPAAKKDAAKKAPKKAAKKDESK